MGKESSGGVGESSAVGSETLNFWNKKVYNKDIKRRIHADLYGGISMVFVVG